MCRVGNLNEKWCEEREGEGEMENEVEMGGPESHDEHVMVAFLTHFLSLSSQTLITPFSDICSKLRI